MARLTIMPASAIAARPRPAGACHCSATAEMPGHDDDHGQRPAAPNGQRASPNCSRPQAQRVGVARVEPGLRTDRGFNGRFVRLFPTIPGMFLEVRFEVAAIRRTPLTLRQPAAALSASATGTPGLSFEVRNDQRGLHTGDVLGLGQFLGQEATGRPTGPGRRSAGCSRPGCSACGTAHDRPFAGRSSNAFEVGVGLAGKADHDEDADPKPSAWRRAGRGSPLMNLASSARTRRRQGGGRSGPAWPARHWSSVRRHSAVRQDLAVDRVELDALHRDPSGACAKRLNPIAPGPATLFRLLPQQIAAKRPSDCGPPAQPPNPEPVQHQRSRSWPSATPKSSSLGPAPLATSAAIHAARAMLQPLVIQGCSLAKLCSPSPPRS